MRRKPALTRESQGRLVFGRTKKLEYVARRRLGSGGGRAGTESEPHHEENGGERHEKTRGERIGLGASASLFPELGALVGEPAGPPPAVVLVSVPGFVAVPLFPQPAIVNNPATIPHNAHCFFMNFSPLRKIF